MPESHPSTADPAQLQRHLELERLEQVRIERALSQNQASLTYLNGLVDDHSSTAARMRQLANGLTIELQPLRGSFNAIRQLHTTNTWQGQAATASRLRLDGHETRYNSAIQSIDRLIDDLIDQAEWHTGEAADLSIQIGRVRSAIHLLERQRLD